MQYDVPVGVKIAASHYIEDELDVILQTNIDLIVIDGSEGGTAASFVTLQDSVGLPTLVALGRAVKYLESKGVKDKYDLIITGAMIQSQLTKAMPQYPAPQLVMYNGKLIESLDINKGAQNLSNFLNSCNEEI